MAQEESRGEGAQANFLDAGLNMMRDFVGQYIDASAGFAKQLVELQAQSTSWAKDTPLGPFFQSQNALSLDLIECWAGAARSLWRIESPAPKSVDGGI